MHPKLVVHALKQSIIISFLHYRYAIVPVKMIGDVIVSGRRTSVYFTPCLCFRTTCSNENNSISNNNNNDKKMQEYPAEMQLLIGSYVATKFTTII